MRHNLYSEFYGTRRRLVGATACFQMIEDLKDQTVSFVLKAKKSYGWILNLALSKLALSQESALYKKGRRMWGRSKDTGLYCNYTDMKERTGWGCFQYDGK